jgi:hypothetical protein
MASSNQHLVCVECEDSGLSVTVEVAALILLREMPQQPGCNGCILSSTASRTEGQGTVNCPYANDPCGRVASHIAWCVWYLTGRSFIEQSNVG